MDKKYNISVYYITFLSFVLFCYNIGHFYPFRPLKILQMKQRKKTSLLVELLTARVHIDDTSCVARSNKWLQLKGSQAKKGELQLKNLQMHFSHQKRAQFFLCRKLPPRGGRSEGLI